MISQRQRRHGIYAGRKWITFTQSQLIPTFPGIKHWQVSYEYWMRFPKLPNDTEVLLIWGVTSGHAKSKIVVLKCITATCQSVFNLCMCTYMLPKGPFS